MGLRPIYRWMAILVLGIVATPAVACVIGSATVQGKNLVICEYGITGSPRYTTSVNNRIFLDFLKANLANRELSTLNKAAFGHDSAGLIAYLENEIKENFFQTTMFADTESAVPNLEKIANIFNRHYQYSTAIAEEKLKMENQPAGPKESTSIGAISEIDQIADNNGREIPGLKKRCLDSKAANVSNVNAIEVTYSDGEVHNVMPVLFMKFDGNQNQGDLVLIGEKEFDKRTIIARDGKFYWVAKDEKEWLVTLKKVSIKKFTWARPLGFGHFSDACYLSSIYEDMPGAANPKAATATKTTAQQAQRKREFIDWRFYTPCDRKRAAMKPKINALNTLESGKSAGSRAPNSFERLKAFVCEMQERG